MKNVYTVLFLFFLIATTCFITETGAESEKSSSPTPQETVDVSKTPVETVTIPKDLDTKPVPEPTPEVKKDADKKTTIFYADRSDKKTPKNKKADVKVKPSPVNSPKAVVTLTWDIRVIGVILVALGVLLTFSGKRFFKIFLGSSGFLAFALLAINLISFFEEIIGFQTSKLVFFSLAGIAGLIGAAVCFCLWEIGVLACAGFGGYCLAVWIMSMKAGGIIESFLGRGAFITAITVLAIIVAWFFDNIAIVAASAIAGASCLVVGIDCFLNWGILAVVLNILIPGDFAKLKFLDVYCYMEIAAVAVLAVIGVVVQYLSGTKGSGYSRSDKA